jgi:hypothetical protein
MQAEQPQHHPARGPDSGHAYAFGEAAPRPAQGRAARYDEEDPATREYVAMLRKWIWRDFASITLGFWLISAPFTLGYAHREPAMAWNDVLGGAAVVVLGALTLVPRLDLLRWGICFVGIWLLFAPLVFWTRDAGAYNNDTLVGALLVLFSVVIPMMPGRAHFRVMMLPGPDVPPGWSYNPSDWMQRGPIVAVAFLGFFVARYLAAYQLGHTPWPWDPFFGDGTRRILESDVAKAWPVPDAGLGAVAYLIEALTGCMGPTNRWRTMPWMVALFGVLVVPMGVVSVMLVILQPVAVGAWCTLCLVSAAATLIMISPGIDEVMASCQFLARARREGKSLWRTFWVGGTLDSYRDAGADDALWTGGSPDRSLWAQFVSALDLNNVPWNMLVSAGLGVWLMAAPGVLWERGAAALNNHVVGALIVTGSVIAFAEIARPARFLNIPLGIWLIAAPWVLFGDTTASRWNDVIVGAAVALMSFRRGRIEERFGSWNRYLV